MPEFLDPVGGKSSGQAIVFTGYNIHATAGSRTIFNADLAKGMVLQIDPHITQTTGSGELPPLGQRVGTPTAGEDGAFFVVDEAPARAVNDIPDSATPTLRRGGQVRGQSAGFVKALVTQDAGGALAIGTKLSPNTTGYLIKTAPTTVAHLETRVGATSREWAVLREAVAQGSGVVLATVEIIR